MEAIHTKHDLGCRIQRFFAVSAVCFLLAGMPVALAQDKSVYYEPDWMAVDYVSNVTVHIDRNSIKVDEETGIVSFFAEEEFNPGDLHDGEIQTVAGRIDYNPKDGTCWIRSLNYIRKNSNDMMDGHAFYQPDWRAMEGGSLEAAVCEATMKCLTEKTDHQNGEGQN